MDRRPRRFNFLWLVLLLVVVVGTTVMFSAAAEGPSTVASKFLVALSKGDVNDLVKYGYLGDQSEEESRKQWEETLRYSKNYLFAWKITGDDTLSEDTAVVRLGWVQNAQRQNAYEDVAQLPLRKINGKWLVDVRSISREMYPALPR